MDIIGKILRRLLSADENREEEVISKNKSISSNAVKEVFNDCYDFESRNIAIGGYGHIKGELVFVDGLVSGKSIAEQVIRPLTSIGRFGLCRDSSDAVRLMMSGSVYGYTAKERTDIEDVISDILNGFCAIIFDDLKKAVTFEVKSEEKRSIDKPKEEKVVKGSKDAFIEILKSNTTLIRKKLRDPNLKIKQVMVGSKSKTAVGIVYIEDYTNTEMVTHVINRIKAIKIDGVLTSAAIEETIADQPKTPFPQLITTERPDKFCMNLLEGRVGILVDGLPVGYLAPGTFAQFFKVPEDIANHYLIASALTILRYLAIALTLLLPAFYVGVAMYHQEMIPLRLLQSMIDAKQSVPFPTGFEVIAMLIAFELLQEAGLRLPDPIGQTVSIIGALVVGQSAVEAKVVSPVVVVIVAVAGIAGYTVPNQDMSAALRICRFLLVIITVIAGMFGLAIGCSLILYHLCTLDSFGVPYMTPFAGNGGRGLKRALSRRQMRKYISREDALKTKLKDRSEG